MGITCFYEIHHNTLGNKWLSQSKTMIDSEESGEISIPEVEVTDKHSTF
jgi:hypothetical protein